MQSVGSVCGSPYAISAALRCSPFVCLADTVMIVIEVLYLRYKAGCSFQVATRHVWYDRFRKEPGDYDQEFEARFKANWRSLVHELRQDIPEMIAFGITYMFGSLPRFMTRGNMEGQIQLETVHARMIEGFHSDVFITEIPDTWSVPRGSRASTELASERRHRIHKRSRDKKKSKKPSCSASPTSNLHGKLRLDEQCVQHPKEQSKHDLPGHQLRQIEEDKGSPVVMGNTRKHMDEQDRYNFESEAGPSTSPQQPSWTVRYEEVDVAIEMETSEVSQDLADLPICLTETDNGESPHVQEVVSEFHTMEPMVSNPSLEDMYYPGSAIDRTWRYSIGAFLIGALPQTIKVFAMQGIPWTQLLVANYLIAYIIPELLRLVAGPAGTMELHPLPIVLDAKGEMLATKFAFVSCSYPMAFLAFGFIWLEYAFPRMWKGSKAPANLVTLSLVLSSILSVLITASWRIFTRTSFFVRCETRFSKECRLLGPVSKGYEALSSLLTDMFALSQPTFLTGPRTLLILVLALVIGPPLFKASWDGYIMSYKMGIVTFLNLFLIPLYMGAPPLFLTVGLRIVYRFCFMGCFSHLPRRVTGVGGTLIEFFSACLLLYALCLIIACYTLPHWDAKYTYKPPWTEILG
jgi:hypothetical protein